MTTTQFEEKFEGYQFEKCCEPDCTEDATFITLVESELVCYCDAHGVLHGLRRGNLLWVSPEVSKMAAEFGERGKLTSDALLNIQRDESPVPYESPEVA